MQELDDYINKCKQLPPAPKVLPLLLKRLSQPNLDSDGIVQLVALDPALTASALLVCNSAYFGSATSVGDLREAVTRLGFQNLYRIVAAVSGARALGPAQKGYGIEEGELWRHSVTTAVAAQLVAKDLGADENLAFTAGLLHDIGKIVLAQTLEHIYTDLVAETERNQSALLESEKKLLGVQHAEVGGRLLARWNFPADLVAAVWFHHHPGAASPHQRLASLVYLGNMIAYFIGAGYGHMAFAFRGRAEALQVLDLSPDEIPKYMIRVVESLEAVEALLSIAR
jgi:putative nucleotidyltransferase with HDIG domain